MDNFSFAQFETNIFWTDWYNKSVYRSQRMPRGVYGNAFEVRDALSGALDIRAVSLGRQPKSWNHCAQDNGGCSHLCLYRAVDYVCACPDRPDPNAPCSTKPKMFVHSRLDKDQAPEYSDESTDDSMPTELLGDSVHGHGDDEHTRKTDHEREFFVLVALGVVIVMVVITILVIFSKKMSILYAFVLA